MKIKKSCIYIHEKSKNHVYIYTHDQNNSTFSRILPDN